MCKKSLLMMLLLALLVPWAAKAQTTVTIGEGTATSNTNPIGTYYNYSIAEQLYTAEEIGTAGTISSISFYYMGIAAKDLPITVYMKHVDEEDLASGGITLADANEVFSGTLPVTTTAGWVTINLATPFAYDGSSNLLIGFIKDYLYYFSGQSWQGTATTSCMARYTQNDYNAYTTSTVPSSEQANRPNIQIEITPTGGGPTCTKPSTLDVTDIAGYSATCTWENTGAASYTFEWKKASDSDYTVVPGLTANTYALSGLEPFTAYNVRVKAVCDTDLESGYKTANFTTLDVCPDGKVCIGQGTATNSYLPGYTYYNYTLTQQIYTAEEIGGAGLIESIDFYCSGSYSRTWDLYMVNTEKDVFADGTDWITVTSADLVYSGSVTFAQGWNTLTLNNPFIFMGRTNVALIVDDNTGSWVSAPSFYVFNTTESQAIYVYSDGTNYDPMNPPTSYTSSEYHSTLMVKNRVRLGVSELPACMWPTNLAVSNVTANSAELSWTSDGTAWQIGYSTDGFVTEQYVEVTENPYTLTGLDPETDYEVRVQKNCGGGTYSLFCTPVSFTTEVACPAPTDLVISDITAYSANVNWSPSEGTFEFRYSPDVRPITNFDDSQMHNWTNIDADGDGYVWVLGSEAAGVYHNAGVDVTGQGYNSSHDFIVSGSYSNYAGVALTPDNYLVSPQITLGGSISFWACAQDVNYPAEHFGVAVSTTGNTDAADFTTIQEWTMTAKSAGMLRSSNGKRGGDNLRAGNWYQYTVDLSAYSGQGYVAIRHFDCTDMFMLNVDDIYIEEPGFELPWIYPTTLPALTNLDPETTYIVQVRANCGDEGYSSWLEGTFTTLPACMVPTNLVVSNIDKRSADLAWTPNGEETQWQICLNGDETNLITVSDTSYSFTNLTPETLYNVKVRAYCDETLQSHWSSPAVFTTLVACPAPTALAISDIANVSAVATWTYDGDVEFEYAEDVWRHYDNGVYSSGIGTGGSDVYWAIMLPPTMLSDEPLTTVSVYEDSNNTEPLTIMIYSGGETAPETLLYEETVNTEAAYAFHEITLAEAVSFDATQNLWIVCKEYGTYPANGCVNTGDANGRWISLNGTEWNDVASYDLDYTWMIRAAFGNNTQTEWVAVNNPASPQTIAGLMPETNYLVRLRAVCGGEDGESVWVNTSFTTDIACPAPTALAATPYALSAELSWEGISESYTVSYRTAAYTQGISEEFATSSAPTGWTMYTGLLSNVMEDPSALVSATYGWNFGTGNNVFDSHARCNIYGNYQRWLVTPAIEVPTGASFSFDMALTVYTSSSSASPTPGSQADDKFIVLVSTDNMATWTILRQWDNAGSEYVYDNITNNANGEHVSFDFGAYAGQTVKIAFYGESTVSGGDNNLHIDNVAIGTAMPAGEWMTVNVDEATATITGLTPATKYEWKVQGNCGEWGMSEESAIMSFTTTNDACPVPTNLTVNNETITATTADLSWEGSIDVESFTVRYRAPEHYVGGISADFESGTMPAGWTQSGPGTWSVNAGYGYNSIPAHGGTYNVRIGHTSSENETFLITPMMDLSGQTDPTLSFWYINYDWGSDIDQIYVYYRVNEGEWVELWNTTEAHQEWTESGEIALPNPSANYQVGFKMVDKWGRGVGLDDIIIGNPTLVPATDWQTIEGITDMNVTLTGLTPETPYEAQVKADCSDPEAWSNTVSFTTLEQTTVTQTIALVAGANWFSTNVEITLDDLKAALVATGNTNITIKSKNQNTYYQNGRWRGTLTFDVANMYIIKVGSACEITLEGMPLDPTEHPITIKNGPNWIGFPLNESMTVANAFAGFVQNGDIVKAKSGSAQYLNGRWRGSLTLIPGQGYIYKSAVAGDRTFVFPTAK